MPARFRTASRSGPGGSDARITADPEVLIVDSYKASGSNGRFCADSTKSGHDLIVNVASDGRVRSGRQSPPGRTRGGLQTHAACELKDCCRVRRRLRARPRRSRSGRFVFRPR